ncbi:hypothetical protein HER32_11470 [Hymenobacter sp. BT18]|uniref:hypothetical protein n=1 Tax=Hymenobacter sp. BT18 TaxID=2835648 RepID=UPI00143E22C8|nr:hypothetical protein [Hymenobacter sp. BT18]QIX61763.1 hypothetical protein HER32_11470 [Hymenobacter sp. BT18]
MNSFRPMLALSLLIVLTFSLSSCEVIGDIFKAGALTGIIGAVLLVLLIWWLLNKIRRR